MILATDEILTPTEQHIAETYYGLGQADARLDIDRRAPIQLVCPRCHSTDEEAGFCTRCGESIWGF